MMRDNVKVWENYYPHTVYNFQEREKTSYKNAGDGNFG